MSISFHIFLALPAARPAPLLKQIHQDIPSVCAKFIACFSSGRRDGMLVLCSYNYTVYTVHSTVYIFLNIRRDIFARRERDDTYQTIARFLDVTNYVVQYTYTKNKATPQHY